MLNITNLNVTLNPNSSLQRHVLQDFNMHITNGEFVVIIGNNGCGKSTLFNTLAAYLAPESGSIVLDQQNVSLQEQSARARLVSLVMQDPRMGTMENLTLAENLSLAYLRGQTRTLALYNTAVRREFFKNKLALLGNGLEQRLDDLVINLSGGQRQSLSLIMALLADYKLLLLDEITAALDPKAAENVMALAAKLVQVEKRTALMITHNMQHALHYGSRTLLMANGRIMREYTQAERLELKPADLASALELYS